VATSLPKQAEGLGYVASKRNHYVGAATGFASTAVSFAFLDMPHLIARILFCGDSGRDGEAIR
jgi:hypothetical protein